MRRRQIIVLEVNYTEMPADSDSSHTLPPSKWNWRELANQTRLPEDPLVLVEVIAATDHEPV